MKSRRIALIMIAAVFLLVACSRFFGPHEVEVQVFHFQDAIAPKFPFKSQQMDLFDISLSKPKLALQPNSSRMLVNLDTSVDVTQPEKNTWVGNLTFSGLLQFDPVKNTVVLTDLHMTRMEINNIDASYMKKFSQAAAVAVTQALKDQPIYTFTEEDLKKAGSQTATSTITTKPDSIVINFDPAK